MNNKKKGEDIMNKCPYCNEPMEIVDVTFDGYDVYGCMSCYYIENEHQFAAEKEMEVYA